MGHVRLAQMPIKRVGERMLKRLEEVQEVEDVCRGGLCREPKKRVSGGHRL